LRVIHGRDARATPSNCTTTNDTCIINNEQRFWYTFRLRQYELFRR